jgi:hypothetical protein
MLFVEAVVVGFVTALVAAVLVVAGPLLSMGIATRRLIRRHRGALQGMYLVVRPAFVMLVAAAFLIGFGLRLWVTS